MVLSKETKLRVDDALSNVGGLKKFHVENPDVFLSTDSREVKNPNHPEAILKKEIRSQENFEGRCVTNDIIMYTLFRKELGELLDVDSAKCTVNMDLFHDNVTLKTEWLSESYEDSGTMSYLIRNSNSEMSIFPGSPKCVQSYAIGRTRRIFSGWLALVP